MAYPSSPARSRSVGAVLIVALFLSTTLAACRSPLALSVKRVDCSMTFVMGGGSAPPVGDSGSRARLLLPSASRLTVTLTPDGGPATEPVSSVVDIAAGAKSVDVAFLDIPLGSYAVVAEASDATGTVLFRQESSVELGPENETIDLCLVPAAAGGSPFAHLESARSILQSFSAYEARTWTVPRAAFADGALSLVAERTAGLLLFVQNARGALLNSDSSERAVDCPDLTGEALIYVTLYNKSAAAGTAALSLNVPRTPAARWTFEVASTTDFPESIGGIVATGYGTSRIVEWYNYRSAGALVLASSQSSYLGLSSSAHADAPPPWTVCAWLMTTSLGQTQALLTGSDGQTLLASDLNQKVSVTIGGNAYAFSSSIDNYEWTHVAVVNSGHDIKLYVNGVPDGVAITDPAAVAMKLPLSVIGNDASSHFFEGRVDDLRAYRVALSAGEVASLLASYPKELSLSPVSRGSVSASPDLSYYEPGTVVTLTAVPEDATWKFDGWSGDATGAATSTVIVMDADKTVGATFSTAVPRYGVTYDYNGGTFVGGDGIGTGAPTAESSLVSGTSVIVNSAGYRITHPTNPALYFTGWNTQADGNGQTYWPGDTLTVGSSDVTLYAKWELDDAPDASGRASASPIMASSLVRGYCQYNGDIDYYKFVPTQSGTVTLTLNGVLPGLFSASICEEDLSGYYGTGWNNYVYSTATKSVIAGTTYYVYVSHQAQANHNGAARVGVYTVLLNF